MYSLISTIFFADKIASNCTFCLYAILSRGFYSISSGGLLSAIFARKNDREQGTQRRSINCNSNVLCYGLTFSWYQLIYCLAITTLYFIAAITCKCFYFPEARDYQELAGSL